MTSHQENLATLVSQSLRSLPLVESGGDSFDETRLVNVYSLGNGWLKVRKPDIISVTRGPGFAAALSAGLDTAKGLAVAWQIPLVGVNHMQAHALTPRLVHSTQQVDVGGPAKPEFPFLTLLLSGGHTLLVLSKSLCNHAILASTVDIAIGDAIDKMARSVLPPSELKGNEIMYGRILERFSFPNGAQTYQYSAPNLRAQGTTNRKSQWGWTLPIPLAEGNSMKFSFSGLGSAIKRICDNKAVEMDRMERIELAREGMRVAFEHVAMRVFWALSSLQEEGHRLTNLAVSGGVASNYFLRLMYVLCSNCRFKLGFSLTRPDSLRSFLDARGFSKVRLDFPPVELCTDNAAMIGWAGLEMYQDGWETDLDSRAIRKWSIDPEADDGGIMGAPGWKRRIAYPGGRNDNYRARSTS